MGEVRYIQEGLYGQIVSFVATLALVRLGNNTDSFVRVRLMDYVGSSGTRIAHGTKENAAQYSGQGATAC